jgi:hypothetical protein
MLLSDVLIGFMGSILDPARRRHSGPDAEFRQNESVEDKPRTEYEDKR